MAHIWEVFKSSSVHAHSTFQYSGVRVIATRILQEISLLIGELAIRGTKLTIIAGLGTENKLLIEQYILLLELLLGEHYCTCHMECYKLTL